jgi:hypothetical protein
MKTRFCFLLCFVFVAGIALSYGEDQERSKVDVMIESIRNNKEPSSRNVSDATTLSLQLLERAKNTTDTKLRCKIGKHAGWLEVNNRTHKHSTYRSRSNNFELRDELINEIELEKGADSVTARLTSILFHPEDLKNSSQRVRAIVHQYPQYVTQPLMVLYANLPDNNKKEELTFVKSVLSAQATDKHDALFCQALCARFGDKDSEKQLIDFVTTFWAGDYDSKRVTDVLKDVLVCAGTEKIMKLAALGLQSEKQIRLPGSVYVSEMSICQDVLIVKYQDDPSFPLPKPPYHYSSQELLEAKKWCEKHLGVKYPAPVPAIPISTPLGK